MTNLPDAASSEHLLDAHITVGDASPIGRTPFGRRSIVGVREGTFEGPKLRGVILPGGGDWLLTSDGGHNELDVRATLRTDDGALIYLRYNGVLKIDPAVAARVFAGEDVNAAEYYFRTAPRFETGHEAYAWLNDIVCVGYGQFGPNRVAYRIFAIT